MTPYVSKYLKYVNLELIFEFLVKKYLTAPNFSFLSVFPEFDHIWSL